MANAWKIARRSNAQLPLVIVIALAIVLVLVGKAQSGLFDRARAHVTDWMAPALEKVRAPVQGFDRWIGSIGEIFSVYEQNLKLKEENARLRQWRNVAIVLQGRVGRYQTLLHAVPDPKLNAVLARVIGRASRPFLQTMILDAGKMNHAAPGQAVVDARGMIGRVYLTGERTSWVILLTDINSRIPVTIAPTSMNGGNVQAIMTGDNTAMPSLDMVSRLVTLHAGDQVVSSGDGGLLPSGLPVGTVVPDNNGGYRVALLADASSSQDVEILNFSKPPEALPPTAQLPAEAAGLKPMAPPPPPVAAPAPVPVMPAPVKPKPVTVAPAAPAAADADGGDVDR
ncbi:MAG TPA: rod shape-determining protein MreC [Rhizomicrobium sp.]|nr:rod shape-determining protein MreC [Rhizomicrobium sp.]